MTDHSEITLGDLLRQQGSDGASKSTPENEDDHLFLRLPASVVRGTASPTLVDRGRWFELLDKAASNSSLVSLSLKKQGARSNNGKGWDRARRLMDFGQKVSPKDRLTDTIQDAELDQRSHPSKWKSLAMAVAAVFAICVFATWSWYSSTNFEGRVAELPDAPSVNASGAPYAAIVVDARNGKVLHSRNADTRLHPASLTKMMTLYVVFEAVENGEISLDTKVRISKKAASEPPSKLGLREGQRIQLRYLMRAVALKSANDASTAIAEAVSGSESAFARRMNRSAAALGMTRSTFKNAHGLTQAGHLSTARDMTILGRHVLFDYPEYYNLFSRRTTDVGVAIATNTNRRLLDSYKGADGIKSGYTRASGFSIVASAERGSERIIATVFGARSSATRTARVAELLDLGFRRAPTNAKLHPPTKPIPDTDGVYRPFARSPEYIGHIRPKARPDSLGIRQAPKIDPEVDHVDDTLLLSSAEGREAWGIELGTFRGREVAEARLREVVLLEDELLDGSQQQVHPVSVNDLSKYEARLIDLEREDAEYICERLRSTRIACRIVEVNSAAY